MWLLGNDKETRAFDDRISYSLFRKIIKSFIANQIQNIQTSSWFMSSKPSDHIINAPMEHFTTTAPHYSSPLCMPFIQKKILSPTDRIIVIADLHGDIDALKSIITHLISIGYLTIDGTLRRSDVYLVFLGDYINRGNNSIPVVAHIMNLYLKNSSHVFMLRGNHESMRANILFDKKISMYDTTQISFLHELKKTFPEYVYPDLLMWYDYLPLALYVGVENEEKVCNYTLLSHAGIEVGDTILPFLSDNKSSHALLSNINRATFFSHAIKANVIQEKDVHNFIHQQCFNCHNWAQLINRDNINPAGEETQSFVRLGYQWSYLVPENNHPSAWGFSCARHGLYINKNIVDYYCASNSNDTTKLISFIRGHQHSDEIIEHCNITSSMLTSIKKLKGCIKHWQGLAYTLGAASSISGYQSFIILQLAKKLHKSTIHHHFKQPAEKYFSISIKPYF